MRCMSPLCNPARDQACDWCTPAPCQFVAFSNGKWHKTCANCHRILDKIHRFNEIYISCRANVSDTCLFGKFTWNCELDYFWKTEWVSSGRDPKPKHLQIISINFSKTSPKGNMFISHLGAFENIAASHASHISLSHVYLSVIVSGMEKTRKGKWKETHSFQALGACER